MVPPGYEPDDAAIQELVNVTGCDVAQAKFMLEASHGNVELAANMFLEQSSSFAVPMESRSARSLSPARPRPAAVAYAQNARPPGGPRLVQILLQLPWWLLRTSTRVVGSAVGFSFTLVQFVCTRLLPAPVLHRVQRVAEAFSHGAEDLDPEMQATRFVQQFTAQYGERHPRFLERDWNQALTQCKEEYKFLLAYLHSPQHEDTDEFCRSVLCSTEVIDYLNQNFICWGGSIRFPQPFVVAGSYLKASTYPFLAVLAHIEGHTRLVTKMEGAMSKEQVLAALAKTVEDHGLLLLNERLQREEQMTSSSMRSALIQEQDDEYERSLAADKERERLRQEELKKKEEEERAAQKVLEEARQAEQAEQRRREEQVQWLADRQKTKAASLPSEPPAGSEGCAMIRVRLPDGSTYQRRFSAQHTIQVLYDFVDSLDSNKYVKYSLSTSYPRRVYGEDTRSLTLADTQLAPQGALFVIPEDDEGPGTSS